MKKSKSDMFLFLICGLLGIFFFICIYGIKIINPLYDDWLYTTGDLTQHYIGWKFYRNSDLQFPIGLIQGLSYDDVSILYTDSIPLFAIPLKLISSILPNTFQYFGLWGVLCFFLQGGLSSLLIKKFINNNLFCTISSIFFIISPIILSRLFGHASLAGHWIILSGMLICVYNKDFKSNKTPVVLWLLLSTVSAMVHVYLTAMVFILMFGYAIYIFLEKKEIIISIVTIVISISMVVLILYLMGAFYGKSSFSDGGLGVFSSNLNTFFNPNNGKSDINSRFLKGFSLISPSQWEGYAYLGFGMLLICFIASVFVISYFNEKGIHNIWESIKLKKSFIIPIIIVVFISSYLAIFPKVTFNSKILLDFSYPRFLENFLSIFRASGRFIWITFYIIQIILIIIVAKFINKKNALIIISLCISIQITDFSLRIQELRTKYSIEKHYTSSLQNEMWNDLGRKNKHIVFVCLPNNYLQLSDMFYNFAEYADKYSITLSCFYLARSDIEENIKYSYKILDDLNKGYVDTETIYIFLDQKPSININKLNVINLDGYTIGIYTN